MASHSNPSSTVASARREPIPGRLAVLTSIAAGITVLPIPLVPNRIVERLRGAIAYDVVARHGLSLTTGARTILSDPEGEERAAVRKAAEILLRQLLRRLRTLTALTALVRAVEVYALGILLDRYITDVRSDRAVRIHDEEAKMIRMIVDRAVMRALSPTVKPSEVAFSEGAEDLRDEFTRWIDSLLITGASMPNYIERRLEAAFDDVVRTMGMHRG